MHATQSIEILKPLPVVSGVGWKWKNRFTGVAENSEFEDFDYYFLCTPDGNDQRVELS